MDLDQTIKGKESQDDDDKEPSDEEENTVGATGERVSLVNIEQLQVTVAHSRIAFFDSSEELFYGTNHV